MQMQSKHLLLALDNPQTSLSVQFSLGVFYLMESSPSKTLLTVRPVDYLE